MPTDLARSAPSDASVVTARNHRACERAAKRVIDLLGAAVLALLLSPLFLGLSCLILLVDGIPVIYRRRVVGPRGEFDAYKFRTMIRDADAVLASNSQLSQAFAEQFKLKSDPRVTRIGACLRKYSLDELPQLLNVLKGQMSLVGPRMITSAELQKYVPYGALLLTVRPGMTGYWQVKGRQEVSYAERVRMDVYYITNWSLWLDLKIILRTPSRIIRTQGAY
jgi:lipopolysaccharide/colanic/teichoic acid biosynthesis glycosyltransferase